MSSELSSFGAHILERAIRVESERDEWRGRAGELRERLEAFMEDPSLLLRAGANEELLMTLYDWLRENPSVKDLLPTGFAQRLEAQILFNRYGGENPPLQQEIRRL